MNRAEFDSLLGSLRTRMTLDAIGKDLGVTRQAVFMWLKGTALPSDTVLLLAGHLRKKWSSNERAGRKTHSDGAKRNANHDAAQVPQVSVRALGISLQRGADRSRTHDFDSLVRTLRPCPTHAVPRTRRPRKIANPASRINGDPNRDYAVEWKTWRLKRGWYMTDMAEALGLAPATISRIESGKRRPQRSTREKFEALQQRYAEAQL